MRLDFRELTGFLATLIIILSISPILINSVQTGPAMQTYTFPDWENGLRPILSYYSQNVTDTYTTVGFYVNELIFYGHRPLIDLFEPQGLQVFLPVLHAKTEIEVLQSLLRLNIRYFLLPLPSNLQFPIYADFRGRYLVFQIIDSSPDFVTQATFKHFRLVRFIPPGSSAALVASYTDFSHGWNATNLYTNLDYMPNGTKVLATYHESILADDNQTAYWNSYYNNGKTLLTFDDSSHVISGVNSLEINFNGSLGSASLTHYFSPAQDFSSFAELNFYWWGARTNASIRVTLHTRSWTDFFYFDFKDNFSGWKGIDIPFSSMKKAGSPTLKSIGRFEIVLPPISQIPLAIFRLDLVALHGGTYGLRSVVTFQNSGSATLVAELKISPAGQISDLSIFLSLLSKTALNWTGQMISDGGGYAFLAVLPKAALSTSLQVQLDFVTATSGYLLSVVCFEIFTMPLY